MKYENHKIQSQCNAFALCRRATHLAIDIRKNKIKSLQQNFPQIIKLPCFVCWFKWKINKYIWKWVW